jgi:hypothetical protein
VVRPCTHTAQKMVFPHESISFVTCESYTRTMQIIGTSVSDARALLA